MIFQKREYFTIAAGNEYLGGTLATPGNAKSAISVSLYYPGNVENDYGYTVRLPTYGVLACLT